MTDHHLAEDAREADETGERPDLGRKSDALIDALSGTDSGSDTRAGSLQGGAATGSDRDAAQAAVNADLKRQGQAQPDGSPAAPEAQISLKTNDKADPKAPGDDVDAATG